MAPPVEGAELAPLRDRIERLFGDPPAAAEPEHLELLARFREALDRGEARAAEPDPASPWGWRVNPWGKQGLLLGFRLRRIGDLTGGAPGGPRPPLTAQGPHPPPPLEPRGGL